MSMIGNLLRVTKSELEEYLQMTDTMSSSVDRILSKGEIVIDTLKK